MAVDETILREIARSNLNRVPSGKADDEASYIATILVWLHEWVVEAKQRAAVPPGYCAFVLAPEQVAAGAIKAAEELSFFKEDQSPLLGGNVFLTDYALNKVFRRSGSCRDLNELVDLLRVCGLADNAFVAFDVETERIFIFASGIGVSPTKVTLREDIPEPFGVEGFRIVLDDIYRDNLKYPEAYPGLWSDATTRVPCKQTELVVQSHVCAILKARAQGYGRATQQWLTISEKRNNAGRIDIAIFRLDQCVVAAEVKVLRARHHNEKADKAIKISANFNQKWAIRGARQAQRYMEAEPSDSGVLVLYDMRETDEDVQEALDECDSLGVTCLRYYLHNQLPDAN